MVKVSAVWLSSCGVYMSGRGGEMGNACAQKAKNFPLVTEMSTQGSNVGFLWLLLRQSKL